MRPVSPLRRFVSLARPSAAVLSVALAAVPSGCGWVDSTGRQAGDPRRAVEVVLDEAAPGSAIVLAEDSTVNLTARSDGDAGAGDVFAWREDSLEEGALESCAEVDGFRPEFVATAFAEACTDPQDCRFAFELETADGETDEMPADGAQDGASDLSTGERVGFLLRVPPLKAPVGVRRELGVTAADGTTSSSVYDFCLIAINEAPEALDDGLYELDEGETLIVEAGTPESLLANDTDDIDVSNLVPLVVDTEPVRAPTSASDFALDSDGGFRYTARELGIINFVNDSFEYEISDGSFTARATVRLRIHASNDAPVLEAEPPPFEGTVGEPFEADVAPYFSDPEGGELTFSADGEELPPSGSLTLSPAGLLAGVPRVADVGDYEVRVVASDGTRESDARIELTILEALNGPPEYVEGSIDDSLTAFFFVAFGPVGARFTDPDDDPLEFALIGVPPPGITLDAESGELSGRPTARGNFRNLRIVASDPDGESASSDTFSIRVR